MSLYGRPVRTGKTAWYCQNGCMMHWMARRPETRCPRCHAWFVESDKAYVEKHPGDDIETLARKTASQMIAIRETFKLPKKD